MTVPEQCQRCYKYHRKTIDSSCSFCQNIGFVERLLCDITRAAQQDADEFQCAVFRPYLMVVRPQSDDQEGHAAAEQKPAHNLLKSKKVKWIIAHAKQQRSKQSDQPVYDAKYHLCLPIFGRQQVLQLPNDDIDHLAEVVKESSGLFAGNAYFLSLGLDHLHIYFETTPGEAVADIVHQIMAHTENGLRPLLGDNAPAQGKTFRGYWVETIEHA